MKKLQTIITALVFAIFSIGLIAQQIPRVINYQGVLLGSDEQPVAEGDYKITFKLYDDNDNLLWTEEHNKVFIGGGIFHVLLGTVTPLNIPFDQLYYLGIQVGNEPELQPRMLMTSAAYSFNADRVGGIRASTIAEPNTLFPLGNDGKFPDKVLPNQYFIRKNVADTTKGSSPGELLRIENYGAGRGMTVMSDKSHGIYGKSNSAMAGVEGENSATGPGIRGSSKKHNGIIGYTEATNKAGVYGNGTELSIGVWGNSISNYGVYGFSSEYYGVMGESSSTGTAAIYGKSTKGVGVVGSSNSDYGVIGRTDNKEYSGVYGYNSAEDGLAVFSEGDLCVTGKYYGDIGSSKGAPFPTPAYNSGWVDVTKHGNPGSEHFSITLPVNNNLPTTQYSNNNFFIDLMTQLNNYTTNDCVGKSVYYWINNNNSITVTILIDPALNSLTHIRLRVWYIK